MRIRIEPHILHSQEVGICDVMALSSAIGIPKIALASMPRGDFDFGSFPGARRLSAEPTGRSSDQVK